MCRPKEIPLFFLFFFFLIVINLEEPVFTGSYNSNKREGFCIGNTVPLFFTRKFFFVSGNTVPELIFFYVREFFFIYINGKEEIELR